VSTRSATLIAFIASGLACKSGTSSDPQQQKTGTPTQLATETKATGGQDPAASDAADANSGDEGGGDAANKDDGDGSPKPNALELVSVTPLVAAATPASFRTGALSIETSLRTKKQKRATENTALMTLTFDDPDTQCAQGGKYDLFADCSSGANQATCQFIVDVRCRLFHAGPTEIAHWLSNLDQTIAGVSQKMASSYYACADATAPGYNLVEVPAIFNLTGAQSAPQPLDLDFSYYLSCLDSSSANSTGFGRRTDEASVTTTYYYTAQHGATSSMGSVASVDSASNVDFWTTLPEKKNATSYEDNQFSTGLIHIRTTAANSAFEMSFTGHGVGPGCGSVFKSNGTYLFARANINHDRRCDAASTYTGSGPAFDAAKVDVEYCLQVDDPTTISAVAMSNCTDAGLDFDSISIDYLQRSAIEAYNAARVFSDAPVGVAPFAVTTTEDLAEAEAAAEAAATTPSETLAATPGQFSCRQSHGTAFSKNCSVLFEAESVQAAADRCRLAEADGGEGCCTSSSVFVNTYGAVTGFTVLRAGHSAAEGTAFTCE
jgi:hypothetical protein